MDAFEEWARHAFLEHPGALRIGCFGSFARKSDWGVGSDLDIIAITASETEPFERRSAHWDTSALPVPADVVVYSEKEWDAMMGSRFRSTVDQEAIWINLRIAQHLQRKSNI
jgi:predicted nucleotidyltransferase